MIVLALIIWLITGYLFWRAEHYGFIKYWYLRYGEDISKHPSRKHWRKCKPIIVVGGPINLIAMFFSGLWRSRAFKHGITLYFRVP